MTQDQYRFGKELRNRRIGAKVYISAFSEALGIRPSELSAIERGVAQPFSDTLTLDKISRLLSWDRLELKTLADLSRVPFMSGTAVIPEPGMSTADWHNLHPYGACTCFQEGTCDWCKMNAKREGEDLP